MMNVTDLSEEEKSEEKDLSSDSSYDEEYSESKTKKKRTEDYVTVRLPRKIYLVILIMQIQNLTQK